MKIKTIKQYLITILLILAFFVAMFAFSLIPEQVVVISFIVFMVVYFIHIVKCAIFGGCNEDKVRNSW